MNAALGPVVRGHFNSTESAYFVSQNYRESKGQAARRDVGGTRAPLGRAKIDEPIGKISD